MSRKTPFNPGTAEVGNLLASIDPQSLAAGRPHLERSRLERQRQLLIGGVTRFTPITVTKAGIVYDGNHGVRAAAEEGMAVEVLVIDAPAKGFGAILKLPIVNR